MKTASPVDTGFPLAREQQHHRILFPDGFSFLVINPPQEAGQPKENQEKQREER